MVFWDKWFQGIAEWIARNGWNDLPISALVITIVAVIIAIISTTATRLLTDVDSLKDSMQKVNEWNQKRKRAMQTADKKLWLGVKRDEERIKKMQSSMMFKRMKPMLFTTIPFLVIFAILRAAYPSVNCDVNACHNYAWLPFNLGGFPWIGGSNWTQPQVYEGHTYSKVSFTLWYFVVAFAFGSLITRIFGVTPSGAARSQQKKAKPQIEQQKAKTSTSVAKEKLARTKHSAKKSK
jgi:uncharacterized membrane protein (DUF106 family)